MQAFVSTTIAKEFIRIQKSTPPLLKAKNQTHSKWTIPKKKKKWCDGCQEKRSTLPLSPASLSLRLRIFLTSFCSRNLIIFATKHHQLSAPNPNADTQIADKGTRTKRELNHTKQKKKTSFFFEIADWDEVVHKEKSCCKWFTGRSADKAEDKQGKEKAASKAE